MKTRNKRFLQRLLLILVIFILLFLIGVVVGFVVVGKGSWSSIFQWDTWQHIFDFWRS
ncbi:DNA-directed RNA polymerase subunit beta [Catellicoccus marimammalium]|uniref:DNA-directed RNA polymerase subunit beta n=1 Tax=Catellicoccus marimammalium M35/04/3 TaxID=1234409 RepID=K8ZM87_9ENTE|nr:DNA-directed RNA polymerase subunit beta [Catellicoccus marimammalium]EKU27638.1 hypothetical protein C683_0419 [Catellicoccus marimammalium M35/04/3]